MVSVEGATDQRGWSGAGGNDSGEIEIGCG